ncbi:MAG: hypothetical protein AB1814_05165, partial [Thermodesulfobacteriota bacterium]
DNGIGFTQDNYDSFITSDSLYKIKKGGKGLGRVLGFKAFQEVHVTSYFAASNDSGMPMLKRTFSFDPTSAVKGGIEEPIEGDLSIRRTSVLLKNYIETYQKHCPKDLEIIGYRILEHCLPFFNNPNCPEFMLEDEEQKINIVDLFMEKFGLDATKGNFSSKGNFFSFRGFKMFGDKHSEHKLVFAAHKREVVSENLSRYIPNLKSRITDPKKGNVIYVGFIEGPYLDENVSNDRTSFSFPLHRVDDEDFLIDQPCLDDIREKAVSIVEKDLSNYLGEINRTKKDFVRNYIVNNAPQYRLLLPHLDSFIVSIDPNIDLNGLELLLHDKYHKISQQIKRESDKLLQDEQIDMDSPVYHEKLSGLVEQINEMSKSELVQYIVHRKIVLDFLEKALRRKEDSDNYQLESLIHKIVYPMRKTSEDVPYDQQNLWIIDERLNYHSLLISDKPLNTNNLVETESEDRPDLLIFNNTLAFSCDDSILNSAVIIEFKQPGRKDYGKEDPITQVYRLVRDIRLGNIADEHGRQILVSQSGVQFYGYIICDISPSFDTIAVDKGFQRTPDGVGRYFYNKELSVYVEIIPYTKLLNDAKKRNAILFDKLGIPR